MIRDVPSKAEYFINGFRYVMFSASFYIKLINMPVDPTKELFWKKKNCRELIENNGSKSNCLFRVSEISKYIFVSMYSGV